MDQFNAAGRARRNVAHHYDLNGELYSLFLDRDRHYSCAYFAKGTETLEEAQTAKTHHIAAKLCLDRPGLSVLDIGCGWGGMALTLARDYGAKVTGITLSTEQLSWAKARAQAWAAGLCPVRRTGPLIIDFDATLVEAHSQKSGAGPNYKGGYGFSPLACFCDATNEALAILLRAGNRAPHNADDHIEVLDLAFQIFKATLVKGLPYGICAVVAQQIPFLFRRAIEKRPRMPRVADQQPAAGSEKSGDDSGRERSGARQRHELLIQEPHEFFLVQAIHEAAHQRPQIGRGGSHRIPVT